MRVAVTRYGPPTRMLGTLYAPPARVTARYCVPLGTCIATTVASASGVPSWAATTPLIAAVVTPCADSTAGTPSNANSTSTRPAWSNRLVGFTQSSLAAGDGRDSSTHAGPDTGQEVYKGAAELAPEWEARKEMRRAGRVGSVLTATARYHPLPPITADAESRHRPRVRRGRRSPRIPGRQPLPGARLPQRRPHDPRLPRADRGAGAGGRQGLDRDLWHRRGPRRKNHRYRDHRR